MAERFGCRSFRLGLALFGIFIGFGLNRPLAHAGAPSCQTAHPAGPSVTLVKFDGLNRILNHHGFPSINLETYEFIRMKVDSLEKDQMFRNISFSSNTEQASPAQCTAIGLEQYEISWNPKLVASYPATAKRLILMHELGHVELGHNWKLGVTPHLSEFYELEADIFAALAFKKFYKINPSLKSFLNSIAVLDGVRPPSALRHQIFLYLLDL